MSESKHTPGSWIALPNDPKRDDFWRVSDGEDFICQMFSKHGEFENAKANARLIASAPTMIAYIIKKAEAGDMEAAAIVEAAAAAKAEGRDE